MKTCREDSHLRAQDRGLGRTTPPSPSCQNPSLRNRCVSRLRGSPRKPTQMLKLKTALVQPSPHGARIGPGLVSSGGEAWA